MTDLPGKNQVRSLSTGVPVPIEAAMAPARAMASVGRSLSNLGERAGQVADKYQAQQNAAAVSNARRYMRQTFAEHQQWMMQHANEADWMGDLERRMSGLEQSLFSADLPRDLNMALREEYENFRQTAEAETGREVALASIRRARQTTILSQEEALRLGDIEGAHLENRTAVAGGVYNDVVGKERELEINSRGEYYQVQRRIDEGDAFGALEDLTTREDGLYSNFRHLDQRARNSLINQAEQRHAQDQSDFYSIVTAGASNGQYLSRDEAMAAAEEGKWSRGHASAYLRAYGKYIPLPTDYGTYADLLDRVTRHKANPDPGSLSVPMFGQVDTRALPSFVKNQIAADITSAQLSDHHRDYLMGLLTGDDALTPEAKAARARMLERVKEDFDRFGFGKWENEPTTPGGPKVKDHEAWLSASRIRAEVTMAIDEWLQARGGELGEGTDAIERADQVYDSIVTPFFDIPALPPAKESAPAPKRPTPSAERFQNRFSSLSGRRARAEEGGATVLLDGNQAKGVPVISPRMVIPDNATSEQEAAANDYVAALAALQKRKFGRDLKPQVLRRSQNGRGREFAFHTEGFSVDDKEFVDWLMTPEGAQEYAAILQGTLGRIPGVVFTLPHGAKDPGAISKITGRSEVEIARHIMAAVGLPSDEELAQHQTFGEARGAWMASNGALPVRTVQRSLPLLEHRWRSAIATVDLPR